MRRDAGADVKVAAKKQSLLSLVTSSQAGIFLCVLV